MTTTSELLARIKAWVNDNPSRLPQDRRSFSIRLAVDLRGAYWIARVENRSQSIVVAEPDFDDTVEKLIGEMAIAGWMRNT